MNVGADKRSNHLDLEAVPATCKFAGVGVSIMKTKGSFLSKKYSLWAVALAALMAVGSPAFAQHGGGGGGGHGGGGGGGFHGGGGGGGFHGGGGHR